MIQPRTLLHSCPVKLLLLILLYVAFGKLGLMLAIPPGYTTIIWPPAGIAIAMMLLYGRCLWVGVVIGAFILSAHVSGSFSLQDGWNSEKAIVDFGIAAGCALQAFVGYTFVARVFKLPLELNRFKDLALLFLIAGPISCLISPAIGVYLLVYSGEIAASEALVNWLTWWLGDTFGVIIFMPLIMVMPFNQNRLKWQGNALGAIPAIALLTLMVPLSLTFYGWKLTSDNAYEQSALKFEALVHENEKALLYRIDSYANALLSGAGYFYSSDHVSRKDWRNYVATLNVKKNLPGINGIGWVDDLKPEDIPEYLDRMHASGMPDFTIHPKTTDRPIYSITFIEPIKDNIQAVGLNIGFEDNRTEAANLARDTGKPAITKKIILVQDAQKTPGFLLLHPVYKLGERRNTIEARRKSFSGWVYAPFIAKNFLNELTKSQNDTLNIRIYDGTKPIEDNLIYSSGLRKDASKHIISKTINVMQQDWYIEWESTLNFEQQEANDNALLVLLSGAFFTVMFGVYLLATTIRRTETMEWMAGERKYALPITVFVVISIGSIALYHILQTRELNYIHSFVEKEANKIELLLNVQIENKLMAMRRMSQRWEAASGTAFDIWQNDAANYVKEIKGLRTVEWVDSTYHVRWVVPEKGNEKAIGLNILFNKEREEALKGAAEKDAPTLTPPLYLVQGYAAFIAYNPLYVNNKFDGFMVAIFDIKEFFSSGLSERINDQYSVEISFDGSSYFTNQVLADDGGDWHVKRKFLIHDKEWMLTIRPTKAFIDAHRSLMPLVTLLAGLIIAVLSALTLRYILMSRLNGEYLTKSNQLNSAIFYSSPYMIIALNKDGRVMSFNHAAVNMLGYSADEVIGKATPALWHDHQEVVDRADALSEELGETIDAGLEVFIRKAQIDGIDSGEWTFIRKDKSRFPVHLTVTPLRNNMQMVTGYLGIAEDITSRKQQQEALKTSEETFRSALENASIGMALVAPDGHWLKVNKALCTLLGYERDELLSNDFQSISHPDDLAQDLEYVKKVLSGEIKSYEMEKRYYHKSGRIIWALLNVSLVRDSDGRPNYFIAQIQDITERKEMERMKSEFISIVSHELRTPLTSIRGSLGLMVGAMAKDMPEKANRLIEIAHKNSERLILMINDILDIDKIASGQMRFDLQVQPLAPLVQNAVETNQPYANKLDVMIVANSIDRDLKINVDSARLSQVFANLLSNAAKFSNPGNNVEVITEVKGDKVRVSVIDHGLGIAEEFRSRIFGKFSQEDSSATRSKGGTGLGLHISKQMIDSMGGEIGFDSEVNKGTSFWFEFPLFSEDVQTSDEDHENEWDDMPVLIVEDDESIAHVLQALLENAGFEADIATDIPIAREMLANKPYKLVTLDLMLPSGDGMTFIRELRENPSTVDVPVIVVSAFADDKKNELRGDALGVVDWLQKPINEDKLLRLMKQNIVQNDGKKKILHVEDDEDLSAVLAAALHDNVQIVTAATIKEAEKLLSEQYFNMIVLDLELPDGSGAKLLERLPDLTDKAVPVLILSASEAPKEVQRKVEAAMVKSRMSETRIVETILQLINSPHKKKGSP
ncbi:MAG: CHASE domain-containing protein [Alphaproteobacteria bacterium]|nr:CHASE domain-containing protein [Alphaproteobacteria bacterium]